MTWTDLPDDKSDPTSMTGISLGRISVIELEGGHCQFGRSTSSDRGYSVELTVHALQELLAGLRVPRVHRGGGARGLQSRVGPRLRPQLNTELCPDDCYSWF